MATKEAVFSLKVDTGSSVNDIKSFDQAVNSLNKDVNTLQSTVKEGAGTDVFADKLTELNAKVEAGGLSMREMTKTMKEYQNIAAQAGMESPVGQAAIAAAGQLKDGIGDIKSQVNALSSDTVKLDTAMGALQGGAAVFQGISSAIALTGVENEQLMQTMVKLQAVQGVMNSINEVAVLLNEEHVVGMQLRAFWEKAYAAAVGTSTGAMKAFKLTLAATGIGALIIGLGLLVANWDKVMSSLSDTTQRQKDLNATMDAYKSAAVDATMQTNKVKNAFDLAREGVISKEEALATYNKELGDTFGAATDLNEAEKLFADKTEAYIQAASLRAQADALMKIAAQERVEALLADQETEKIANSKAAKDPYNIVNITSKKVEAHSKEKKARADDLDDLVKDLTKQAEEIENKNKIVSSSEKAVNDDTESRRSEAAEKQKARLKEEMDRESERKLNIINIRNELLAEIEAAETAYNDSLLSARDKELQDVNDYYGGLISRAEADGKDTTTLKLAQQKLVNDINTKFNQEEVDKLAETEQKKIDLIRAANEITMNEFDKELSDFETAQEEKVKKLNEAHQLGLISDEDYIAKSKKLEEDYSAKIIEINDKRTKATTESINKEKEERIKAIQDGLAQAQEALDTASGLNDALNEIQDNKLKAMQAETDAQLSELDIRKNAELSAANLTAAQKEIINKKYALQAYELQKKQFDAEEKIKKQQFARDKALKLASIAINTAEAVMKSVAASPTTGGLPFSAFSVALGVAQAAAVMSTKYEGGAAPSMPDFNASGGTGASASALGGAGTTNAQTTSLADFLPGGSNGPPISQVVVLESDITGTQQKVQTQQSLSTY